MKPRKWSRERSEGSGLLRSLDDDSSTTEVSEFDHRLPSRSLGADLASHASAPEQNSRASSLKPVLKQEITLATIVAQLQQVWPSLTLQDLLALATSLIANKPLLELAAQQAIAPRSKGVNSSTFGMLTKILFHRAEHGSFDFGGGKGVSLVEQTTNERHAILLIAHTLDLSPQGEASLTHPSPRSLAMPRTAICTHHRSCHQCGGVLRIRKTDIHDIWLLHPSSIERATTTRFDCTLEACKTKHWPDIVELKEEGVRMWVHEKDTRYLKLGRQVYATREFAETYTTLLETNQAGSSSYAETFTKLYCSPPATTTSFTSSQNNSKDDSLVLRASHVWRAFVLHSTLSLSSPSQPFVTLAESTTEEIVALALETFLSERTITGALEHQCIECSRFKRRWKKGSEAEPEQLAEKGRGKKDKAC